MDLRHKFFLQNLSTCKKHAEKLTEWEADYILDLCERFGADEKMDLTTLTVRQFNKVHEIAQEVKKRV